MKTYSDLKSALRPVRTFHLTAIEQIVSSSRKCEGNFESAFNCFII